MSEDGISYNPTERFLENRERLEQPPYEPVASIYASGTKIMVASCAEGMDSSVAVAFDDAYEPVYMSAEEARLFASTLVMAALQIEK